MNTAEIAATIAEMDEASRYALMNLLDRGVSSLPQRQRTRATITAVRKLRHAIDPDPRPMDSYQVRVLGMLAFVPGGSDCAGINDSALNAMEDNGLVQRVSMSSPRWEITAYGWRRLRSDDRAAALVDAAYDDVVFDVHGAA
jgi:hypothetical protein